MKTFLQPIKHQTKSSVKFMRILWQQKKKLQFLYLKNLFTLSNLNAHVYLLGCLLFEFITSFKQNCSVFLINLNKVFQSQLNYLSG